MIGRRLVYCWLLFRTTVCTTETTIETAWVEIINCKMEVESQIVIEVVKISTSRSRFKHIYANLLIAHKIENRAFGGV